MNRIIVSFVALSLVASFIAGCGGDPRPAGMPKLFPVSIVVTQEGQPLAGAMVQLTTEAPELMRWGPTGITDADGIAVMRTDGRYAGAPLGTFSVVVSKREKEPHPNPEWGKLPTENPNFQRYVAEEARLKVINYVEPQYSSIADTPLKVEITANVKTYTVDVGKPSKTEVKSNQ
jgi:hypothetical protein